MSRITFIILANSQRAGSTLVQRILALRPNLFIWGESGEFLPSFAAIEDEAILFSNDSAPLRDVYVPMKSTKNVPADALARMQNLTPEPGIVRAAVEAGLREYGRVLHRMPGYDEVGFKAVRATARDVELCCRAWPHANKLLLFREPGASYGSLPTTWRVAHDISPASFSARWTASAAAFLNRSSGEDSCHLIDYDSLVQRQESYHCLLNIADLAPQDVEPVLGLRLNSTPQSERACEGEINYVRSECGELYRELLREVSMKGM